MLNALLQNGLTLLLLVCICILAAGLGKFVLKEISVKYSSLGESLVFSLGIGLGVLSYSMFLLCTFHLLYPGTIFVLLSLASLLSFVGWRTLRLPSLKTFPGFAFQSPLIERFSGIILILFLVAGLLLTLTPAVGNDSLAYHLAVPKLFLEHHGFYFIPGNIFANYPLNGEMLYIPVLFLSGDVLAKGIHFAMALSILAGMWQFMRHHVTDSVFFFSSLLIFFSIPSVFVNAHMAYNDLTFTFYTLLTIYAFLNWSRNKQTGWIIICSALSGLAMGTKYSGLLLPFLGCLGILYVSRHHNDRNRYVLGILSLHIICTLIIGSPFYLKNWFLTGNPFYPFFSKIFSSAGWSSEQARLYDIFLQSLGMGRRAIDYLLLPWNLSFHARMHSPRFDGILGPTFILTLPFMLGMRNIAPAVKAALTFCMFFFLFWASTAQQIRYLFPVFPFLAITTGYILSYYRKHKAVFVILTVFFIVSLGFNGYHIAKDFRKINPFRIIMGQEDREDFLHRMVPSYGMFQYINTFLPENSKILFIYMKNLGYLCDRSYYSDSMLESYTIEKILGRSDTPEAVYDALKVSGFTHILYDINYITGQISTFSDNSKALFLDFQEKYLERIRIEKNRYFLYRLKERRFQRSQTTSHLKNASDAQ